MMFFVLDNPKAGRADAVTDYHLVAEATRGEAPRCPVCGRYLGMIPLLPPVRLELEAWGSRWGDVAFGPGDQILVSGKLMKLFTEADLVGFVRFDPVETMRSSGRKSGAGDPPKYWLASIQRGRAALDESASGVVREVTSMCKECRAGGNVKRLRKVVLEANTWSGEDVFFARGLPGTILVSERFKQLCQVNNLANCSFIAAEDFGFDYYPHESSTDVKRH
jgi:hypothetical protein